MNDLGGPRDLSETEERKAAELLADYLHVSSEVLSIEGKRKKARYLLSVWTTLPFCWTIDLKKLRR